MKKTILSAIALSVAANPVLASSCGNSTEFDISIFEDAKTAFLASDFDKFADVAQPYFPDLKKDPDTLFGALKNVLPGGFDHCVTVLQRRESPGFHQDLVLFFPRGLEVPIALLLVAVVVDGQPRLIEFNYNTNVSGVLEELK